MQSKGLKQKVNLAFDVVAAKGPFTVLAVAEEAMYLTSDDDWCLADQRDARLSAMKRQVKMVMSQPCSQHFLDRHVDLRNMPKAIRKSLGKIPRALCISPSAGPHAMHDLIERITVENLNANLELRSRIRRAVDFSMDDIRNFRDLLVANNVDCLSDLSRGQ